MSNIHQLILLDFHEIKPLKAKDENTLNTLGVKCTRTWHEPILDIYCLLSHTVNVNNKHRKYFVHLCLSNY